MSSRIGAAYGTVPVARSTTRMDGSWSAAPVVPRSWIYLRETGRGAE
jgi:hypothetical protein